MSQSGLTAILVLVAVVSLGMAVWYVIPGIYHPFVFHGDVNAHHYTHAAAFVALAVLSGIATRFVRSSGGR